MKDLLFKIAVSGSVKLASAVIAFLLTLALTRSLGASESGYALLAISLLAALSIFFRLGLDNVILRLVGAEGASASAQGKLQTGLLWIVSASFPFALLVSLNAGWIASTIFNKPAFTGALQWSILALPVMAVFMLLAMAFVGLQQIVRGTLFQQLGLGGLFLCFLTVLSAWYPDSLSAEVAAKLYLLAALLIAGLALIFWCCKPGVQLFQRGRFFDPALWAASSNLWVASIMSLAVAWSGILVAGAYLPAAELAHLSAAQRTAQLTSFVLVVVNMVVAPRYARMWVENNVAGIQQLAKWSTRGMIVLVLPVAGAMMIFPEKIMSIFGDGFEQGALLLLIMALGQLVNVATGSVGYLLQMSGHERDFRRVTLFAGPLTIVCAVLFTWQWGAIGAAIATALGLSVQNIGALWMVKKRLGFWPLG